MCNRQKRTHACTCMHTRTWCNSVAQLQVTSLQQCAHCQNWQTLFRAYKSGYSKWLITYRAGPTRGARSRVPCTWFHLFSNVIPFLVSFGNLPVLQLCSEIWQWEAPGWGRCLSCLVFRRGHAQRWWGKNLPLASSAEAAKNRMLKSLCFHSCCPTSCGSFHHTKREAGLLTLPGLRATCPALESACGQTRPLN